MAGKHRAPNPSLQRVGGAFAVGAVPMVLAVAGAGSAQAAPAATAPRPNVAMAATATVAAGAADPQGTDGGADQAQAQAQATAPSPNTFHIGDVLFNAPSWLDADVVNSVDQTAAQVQSVVNAVLDSIGLAHNHSDGTRNNGDTRNNGGTGTVAENPAADGR